MADRERDHDAQIREAIGNFVINASFLQSCIESAIEGSSHDDDREMTKILMTHPRPPSLNDIADMFIAVVRSRIAGHPDESARRQIVDWYQAQIRLVGQFRNRLAHDSWPLTAGPDQSTGEVSIELRRRIRGGTERVQAIKLDELRRMYRLALEISLVTHGLGTWLGSNTLPEFLRLEGGEVRLDLDALRADL